MIPNQQNSTYKILVDLLDECSFSEHKITKINLPNDISRYDLLLHLCVYAYIKSDQEAKCPQ